MSIIHYNLKLVRDKIPQIIELSGKKADIIKLSLDEYREALKDKLIEEAQELLEAETEDQLIDELVDIAEVWRSIIDAFCIDIDDVAQKYIDKKTQKGGFKKKYFLCCVEDQAEE